MARKAKMNLTDLDKPFNGNYYVDSGITLKEFLDLFEEKFEKFNAQLFKTLSDLRIGHDTYLILYENFPDFKARMMAIKERKVEHVEDKLFELIEAKDPGAIKFFLSTHSEDYKERKELEIKNKTFNLNLGGDDEERSDTDKTT